MLERRGYVSNEVQYRQLQADVAIVSFIVLNSKSTYRSRNSLIWCCSIIGNIVRTFLVAERGFNIKSG